MNILFDNNTPRALRRYLTEHTVATAGEKGWAEARNGVLLDNAESEDYEILITADQSMRYQQNMARRRIAVIVLMSNRWPLVRLHTQAILEAVNTVRPGQLVEIRLRRHDSAPHTRGPAMRNADLTPEQRAELDALAARSDAEIDFSDISEITDFSNARRGVFYEAMRNGGVWPPEPTGARLTDTTERGLEDRIVRLLVDGRGDAANAGEISERPAAYSAGWMAGDPADYDRGNCVDLKQLSAFLVATQPNVAAALALDSDNPTRRQFLARLKRELRNRGVIDVLRKGVNHQQHHVDVFYGAPTPGNTAAAARYSQNRFSVTRQLRYSSDEKQRALDLALFVNGLPIATFELKNNT